MEIGRVPKVINGEEICYNCRLREGNYRQVENNFICGPKVKRTYISIIHYNKLSNCYLRCSSCKKVGNAIMHNCLSCRDPLINSLYLYKSFENEGNCYRKMPNSYIGLLHSHDYSSAEKKGIDEDSSGLDCDVCLFNGTCTDNYPFYVVKKKECVEICGFNEIMDKTCLLNNTNALYKLMQDPFNIKDLKEDKNHYEFIKRVFSLMIAQKISSEFNEDANVLSDNIYNLISNGTFFNLPNNQIILGNNISLELTTSELEILKLLDLEKDKTNQTTADKTNNSTNFISVNQINESNNYKGLNNIQIPTTTKLNIEPTKEAILESTNIINPFINTSSNSSINNITPMFITYIPPILNITECEKLIKKINNISEEEQLIIIKGTNYKDNGQYLGNEVIYQLFSTSLMKILSLEPCEKAGINIYITDTFYKNNLLTSPLFQSKIVAVIDNGYNL